MWGEKTYASVVVVILAIMVFVNPSMSFGLDILATLDNDFVIIFSPFLSISTLQSPVPVRTHPHTEKSTMKSRDILECLISHVRQYHLQVSPYYLHPTPVEAVERTFRPF
jgi:hypothetical protein